MLNEHHSRPARSVTGVLINSDGLSDEDVALVTASAGIEFPVIRDTDTAWVRFVHRSGYRQTPVYVAATGGKVGGMSQSHSEMLAFLDITAPDTKP